MMSCTALMRPLRLQHLLPRHTLSAVVATAIAASQLLVQPVLAASNDKPVPSAGVLISQQQHARWVTAFNGWRSAKRTWPGETDTEAELRHDTRLLILPTPTPVLSRQRWLDGRAFVLSSGLIALLDEMLLAEAVSDALGSVVTPSLKPHATCFDAYGQRVLVVLNLNRDTRNLRPPEPLSVWPRLTKLVEVGKAHTIGEAYATEEARTGREDKKDRRTAKTGDDVTGGPCKTVTSALLLSGATQAQVADSADTLALWLFTQQNLQLARLPSVDPPKTDESASAAKPCIPTSTSSSKTAQAVPEGGKALQKNQELAATVASTVQARASVACPPAAVTSQSSLDERVRIAVSSTGRRETKTTEWLRKNMWLFDAGSSPIIKP